MEALIRSEHLVPEYFVAPAAAERVNRSSELENPVLSFFGLFLGLCGFPGIMACGIINDLAAGSEVDYRDHDQVRCS